MKDALNRKRHAALVGSIVCLMVTLAGCGGGGGRSAPTQGSGGGSGAGGNTFQPRAFPGDFSMRLPNQGGSADAADEVYDAALKELFVSNPDMNEVEAYSTVDGQRVGEISVPTPIGLSFFPGDGFPHFLGVALRGFFGREGFHAALACLISPVGVVASVFVSHGDVVETALRRGASLAGVRVCEMYPENGVSSTEGSTIVFAGNDNLEPPGAEYVWRYDAASDTFTGPELIAEQAWIGGSATVDEDGSVIAADAGTIDPNLLPLMALSSTDFLPGLGEGSAWAMNETGSLLDAATHSLVVTDTRNGRELLILGLSNGINGGSDTRSMAIDPTGAKILVNTTSGVSYFNLSVVPLAVGTVSPAQAAAGAIVQIRGSGFVPGTIVQIGGVSAPCTETDSQTLSCTVPNLTSGAVPMALTNPDGQTYTFENALAVQ